ncbi:Synaptobrevin, partial [Penicillium canariense]
SHLPRDTKLPVFVWPVLPTNVGKMVSGFEAVGLALAIFPVLVEGLKFYTHEKGAVSDFLKYQRVLMRISRDLDRERTMFHNTCQQFLEGVASQCGVGEEEVSEMMLDPRDPRWTTGVLVEERIFHQTSVKQYLEVVEDMNEELSRINQLIGIHNGSQPALLDKRTRRRQWKKIILVLTKDSITDHLARANKLNTFLAWLTDQNQPTATNPRPSRRGTKHYRRIRSHAIGLYNILKAQFPSHPGCKCALEPHHVNMRLEFRNAQSTAKGLYFHTIFTSETAFNSASNWREIETEPWGSDPADLCQDTTVHTAQVRFVTTPPMSQESTLCGDKDEISDLCAVITGPASKDWLGFIASTQGHQHRIRAMDSQKRLPAFDTIQTVSLGEVLADEHFGEEQRLRLALKLASSVMQLHTTDWMTDFWSKSDISFLRSSYGIIDFDNPLIGRTFGASSFTMTSLSKNLPHPMLNMLNASIPPLFSLGIVLLELRYRRLFEDLKTEHERTMIPTNSDLWAASRLTADMLGSPNYQNVVRRCIFGLDAAYRSLTEANFQAEVEYKILCPLAEDLKTYCDKGSVEACL